MLLCWGRKVFEFQILSCRSSPRDIYEFFTFRSCECAAGQICWFFESTWQRKKLFKSSFHCIKHKKLFIISQLIYGFWLKNFPLLPARAAFYVFHLARWSCKLTVKKKYKSLLQWGVKLQSGGKVWGRKRHVRWRADIHAKMRNEKLFGGSATLFYRRTSIIVSAFFSRDSAMTYRVEQEFQSHGDLRVWDVEWQALSFPVIASKTSELKGCRRGSAEKGSFFSPFHSMKHLHVENVWSLNRIYWLVPAPNLMFSCSYAPLRSKTVVKIL